MKKIIVAAVICTASLSIWACTTSKTNEDTTASSTAVTEEVSESSEEAEPEQISQDDADQMVAEKLDGLNANAIFNALQDIKDKEYYTYSVVGSDGNELDQMLAVDAVSGEVFTLDFDNDIISDFSNFELYDPESDTKVSWSGTYRLDNMTVTLDPADDSSFEFCFSKDGKAELQGVAQVSGNKADYEDDTVNLTFEFDKDGALRVVNNGNINSYAGIYVVEE